MQSREAGSRDVPPLGADVVLCKMPLLVGTLDVRG